MIYILYYDQLIIFLFLSISLLILVLDHTHTQSFVFNPKLTSWKTKNCLNLRQASNQAKDDISFKAMKNYEN